jgi:hypothetical protein
MKQRSGRGSRRHLLYRAQGGRQAIVLLGLADGAYSGRTPMVFAPRLPIDALLELRRWTERDQSPHRASGVSFAFAFMARVGE